MPISRFVPALLRRFTLICACTGIAFAQVPAAHAPSQGRIELVQSFNALADKYVAARQTTVSSITTRQAAEARQADVHKKILTLLNGLPERTPLNAHSAGIISGSTRLSSIAHARYGGPKPGPYSSTRASKLTFFRYLSVLRLERKARTELELARRVNGGSNLAEELSHWVDCLAWRWWS
jgi:hypothetical protein